jgi:hypothetical protein
MWMEGRKRPRCLSPGFVGVPLAAGRHSIEMRYEPESWKAALGFVGLAGVLLLISTERRWAALRGSMGLSVDACRRGAAAPGDCAGLLLLALPVCFRYSPAACWLGTTPSSTFRAWWRFTRTFLHGVFVPRWAPDLGGGTGQPLFLFHPPMIYYLGELWHLVGFDFVTAMNAGLRRGGAAVRGRHVPAGAVVLRRCGRLAGRRGLSCMRRTSP